MKKFLLYILKKFSTLKHMIIPITLLIVIPIASSFILGYEFSAHQVNHVPTIIVNHDYSLTTQSFVDKIKSNETFNIVAYSDNDDDVKKLIYEGKAAAGIIIPKDFSEDLLNGNSPKIMTFYDGAQSSLASSAKGKISEVLSSIKTEYLIIIGEEKLGLTPQAAKSNILPIGYTSRFIGNPTKNLPNFMLQGILLTIIQVGIVIVGIMIKEKESYFRLFFKGIICALIGSITTFLTIAIQYKYFAVPYKGSITAGIVLTILFSIGMTNFGIFLSLSKNGDKVAAISSSTIVASTMMFSGYTYPIIAMPSIFSKIVRYIPFTYYAIPMRDLSLLEKSYTEVIPDIYWLSRFVIIMWGVTFFMFIAKKLSKVKKVKGLENKEVMNI